MNAPREATWLQNYRDKLIPSLDVVAEDNRTMTSLLGDMLRHAESIYGDRIVNHTILGVSYRESASQVIPPEGGDRMIVIQLDPGCVDDPAQMTMQLAHESIHCLARGIPSRNTNLEEGLAQIFSEEYMVTRMRFSSAEAMNRGRPNYRRAYEATKRLLNHNPDAVRLIREANQWLPFGAITSAHILSVWPGAGEDAITLVQDFPME